MSCTCDPARPIVICDSCLSTCKYCGAPLRDGECINACQEEPTEVSQRTPAPLVELKRKPMPGLVQVIKDLADLVDKGEIIGITFLCNKGPSTVVYYAGDNDFSTQLVAFEDFKFRILVDRNINNPPKLKGQD